MARKSKVRKRKTILWMLLLLLLFCSDWFFVCAGWFVCSYRDEKSASTTWTTLLISFRCSSLSICSFWRKRSSFMSASSDPNWWNGKKKHGKWEIPICFAFVLVFILCFRRFNLFVSKLDIESKVFVHLMWIFFFFQKFSKKGVSDLNSLSFMSIRPKLLSGWLMKKGDRGIVKVWNCSFLFFTDFSDFLSFFFSFQGWKKRFFLQRGKHLQ